MIRPVGSGWADQPMQANLYAITNSALSAVVTDFGASLTTLRLAGCEHSLVLGYPDLKDQLADRQFMGAVIGRYAGRIAGGRVSLSSGDHQLDRNERGSTHLHGGLGWFGTRLWDLKEQSDTRLSFSLVSPAGEAGYPGRLEVEAIYELHAPAILRVSFRATTDQETVLSLCHHPYFNLDGRRDIKGHCLQVHAERYLPSDDVLLPTGEIAPVADTHFDFREQAPLAQANYNHTYCLTDLPSGPMRHAATLSAGEREMQLWTTQPGLHVYNAYKLQPGPAGHEGEPYQPVSAVCLEAQGWPDSPNQPGFPSTILESGEVYQQVTDYKFIS